MSSHPLHHTFVSSHPATIIIKIIRFSTGNYQIITSQLPTHLDACIIPIAILISMSRIIQRNMKCATLCDRSVITNRGTRCRGTEGKKRRENKKSERKTRKKRKRKRKDGEIFCRRVGGLAYGLETIDK